MSNEDLARKVIEKRLDEYVVASGLKPNIDMIEENIRMFQNQYELGLSNFWRLRSYFSDKYLRMKKEE
jgi:hypothetical protein